MRTCGRLVLTTLLPLALLVASVSAVAPAQSATTWTPRVSTSFDPRSDLDEFEARILLQVNRARVRHGLSRVRVFQTCVDGFSERWSGRLKRRDALEHRNLTTVLRRCDMSWVGETLVSGTGLTPWATVRAWLSSPSHRAVLLKRRARLAGVGVRVNRDGKVYAALNFADRS